MEKIEYSIVSRGTEKNSNHGYMAISASNNNKRYLMNVDHDIKEANIEKDTLVFEDDYSISNIAISRFSLISRLILERKEIKDNILITGFGNLGFSLLIELLKRKYKNISIYLRSIPHNINSIERKFGVKVKIVDDISDDYETYIDTTGSSDVLKKIFETITFMKTIIILSTPREELFMINPLMINRKNLSIYGGHELFGIDLSYRNQLFNDILKENKKYESILKEYISINKYTKENLQKLLNKKNNFIDVFKYE